LELAQLQLKSETQNFQKIYYEEQDRTGNWRKKSATYKKKR